MMFSLVDDVESYPAFLPWCNGARVLERNDDEVKASIDISKGALRKTFTTCNRRQKNKMIEMRLVEGPFKKLEGFWRFDSVGDDGCKVSLDLQFEFSNPLMRATIGPVFSQIANTLVDSFCRRAEAVYGT
jgi:ribosome-associated toxin RatA of RatAB toxin-antitoxin module